MALEKLKISQWIEENKADFVPPVCNKCLFSDQLKAFLVGGPNVREDFHLEEGEEFFYMIQGDMCLPTVNQGVIKDIKIKEGQIYMQPARVLHSPQRQADTVGLVVERNRASFEQDALKFFADGNSTLDVCFERWFHLKDAVADLPPIISQYFNLKNAAKLRKNVNDSNISERPYEPNNNAILEKPLYIQDWIKTNAQQLRKSALQLYGPPRFKTNVKVYGPNGAFMVEAKDGEIFVWFLAGSGIITSNKPETWKAVECSLVPIGQSVRITTDNESYFFTVQMPTPPEKNDV